MVRTYRLVALPALAVLLSTGTQECDEGVGGRKNSCDFRPEIQVRDGLVIGTATAECDVPPEIHDFTLRMQLLDNRAEWKFWGKDSSTQIPRPGRAVTLTIKRMCVEGRYRVIGKATGVIEGDNFSFRDQDVREVTGRECRGEGGNDDR